MAKQNMLAILCGGGPAPGINSVISAVTIAAKQNDWEVFGIYDGFYHLAKGEQKMIQLTTDLVSTIHLTGGSILRTSRYNPTKKQPDLKNIVNTLTAMGITHLVTIGGDDTAFSALKISEAAKKFGVKLCIVHIPKTIDNDLPLPEGVLTFGFESARSVGASLVTNLMTDAATTGKRWYLAIAMGRTAGHLALAIGNSSTATITIIPEEFTAPTIRLKTIIDLLTSSIIKQLTNNKTYGVAIVAEGLLEKIDPKDLEIINHTMKDEHEHIRYCEINFAAILKQALCEQLKKLALDLSILTKEIGYELRCSPPNAFDIDYTRTLGYAAFDFLENHKTNAMITLQKNKLVPIPFEEIIDITTGKTQVRTVNIHAMPYKIARKYMVRLEKEDFMPSSLEKLAQTANLSTMEFKNKYEYLMHNSLNG